MSTGYAECEYVKINSVLARALYLKKELGPSRGILHFHLGDWARHRLAARRRAAAESQEGLAAHRYNMLAYDLTYVTLQSLGVCNMI